MDTVLVSVYAFGGLIIILRTVAFILNHIRKNKKAENSRRGKNTSLFCAFMIAFAPWYWYTRNISERIPNGKYEINVSVTTPEIQMAFYLPADISIYNDVDYKDGHYYLGAAEMQSTKTTVNKTIYLNRLYWGQRTEEYATDFDTVVYPETETTVYDAVGNEYQVNIGVIAPQTLGFTKSDLWNDASISSKVELLLIEMCSIVCVWGYWKNDEKEKSNV